MIVLLEMNCHIHLSIHLDHCKLVIFNEDGNGNYPLYGKMQDVRISEKSNLYWMFCSTKKLNSVGVAETTDPVDCREVKLHLKSDTDGSDVNFVDTSNSAHAFSKVGEVFHSEDVIKYGSSSVYIRNNELSYLTARS